MPKSGLFRPEPPGGADASEDEASVPGFFKGIGIEHLGLLEGGKVVRRIAHFLVAAVKMEKLVADGCKTEEGVDFVNFALLANVNDAGTPRRGHQSVACGDIDVRFRDVPPAELPEIFRDVLDFVAEKITEGLFNVGAVNSVRTVLILENPKKLG